METPLALTTRQAATALGLSKTWLEQLRVKGGGPLFVKAGARCLYRPEDLSAWLESRLRENTSQTHS